MGNTGSDRIYIEKPQDVIDNEPGGKLYEESKAHLYNPFCTCDNDGCPDAFPADECGVCGGNGIPPQYCDCDNNVEDYCGVCLKENLNYSHICHALPS